MTSDRSSCFPTCGPRSTQTTCGSSRSRRRRHDRFCTCWRSSPGNVRPAVGSIQLVRGLAEGFPRLYSFIEDLRCIEEVSQLRIEDIVREFPEYRVTVRGDHLAIHPAGTGQPVVEARHVALASETVPLPPDILMDTPDVVVKATRSGTIRVLTNRDEADPLERSRAPLAYRIVRPGTIGRGGQSVRLRGESDLRCSLLPLPVRLDRDAASRGHPVDRTVAAAVLGAAVRASQTGASHPDSFGGVQHRAQPAGPGEYRRFGARSNTSTASRESSAKASPCRNSSR